MPSGRREGLKQTVFFYRKRTGKKKSRDNDKTIIVSFSLAGLGLLLLVVMHGMDHVNRLEDARKVNKIAKHFNCICDMKCSLRLDECSCSMPSGAREKKEFIRDQLKKGVKETDVAVLFNQKYGGLITS